MRLTPSRLILSLSLALGAVGAQALTFNLAPTGNAQADAGFRAAADLWSAQFLDPITINITSTYRSFGNTTTIGQTQNQVDAYSYRSVRSALIADARYPQNGTDPQVIASLPDADGVAWRRSSVTGATVNDDDGSGNNNFLAVTNANAKALGLIAGNATASDALIEFNSGFNFDFDRSNGIGANQIDFIGVAFHEIGHAMGFVSGVDIYDIAANQGYSETQLNDAAIFSPLDLLRYSAANGVKDVRYGTASYFSLNGGVTNLGNMSTGALRGDGRQASHWKDNDLTGTYIGAMDPTAARGQLLNFTVRDGTAFDAIGYDVVPEPATIAALSLGALGLLRRRRAKKS